MDIRVKERLIGGVVLVALIVAFVPELLTGPGRAEPKATEPEGAIRTYTVDLEPPRGSAVPRNTEPPAAPGVTEGDNSSSVATASGDSPEAPTPEVPAPTDAAPAGDSAGSANELDGTVVAGSSAQPPTPATAQAEPPPKPVADEPTTRTGATNANPSSGWAVQLGSFASKQNADRLAGELRQRGYRAFVSRHDSGKSVRYRVRVGPEEERARADALAGRLKREGRQVSVVAYP